MIVKVAFGAWPSIEVECGYYRVDHGALVFYQHRDDPVPKRVIRDYIDAECLPDVDPGADRGSL